MFDKEGLKRAQADKQRQYDAVAQLCTNFTNAGLNVFGQGNDVSSHGFIGWGGLGGSAIGWHPKLGLAIGYAMTGMGDEFIPPCCI